MKEYIFSRLLALVPVLLIVSVLAFALIHVAPGDPVAQLLGEEATMEDVERVRHQLGLDQPLHIQYARWLVRTIQGDLGESLFMDRTVAQAILERAEPTAILALVALFFTLIIGIPAGVLAAVRHNTGVDQALMLIALLGVSMPNFWLGINLILVFSVYLGWFPTGGYVPVSEGILQTLRSVTLPAVALGFSQAALVARMTRASMLEVLRQDYIRTARAKGLPERIVHYRHALKNALIPTITVIGVVVTILVGGAVVTETVFNIPGAGRLVVNAVLRRDYPVIQGAILVVATIYVVINLLVDLVYVYVDPRIRYG